MKFYLIFFLVSVHCLYDTRLTNVAIFSRKTFSNTLHSVCFILADTIKEHPIKTPEIEKVALQLRTSNTTIKVQVNETEQLIKYPEYDGSKGIAIFVPGFMINLEQGFLEDMAKAYHARGGNNFVIYDTGGFLINEYLSAAYHTEKLGKFLAIALYKLTVPFEKIHLIGHSLGAEIVASAGRHFRKLTGKQVARITGLDPARPCFLTPPVFPRLTKDDAQFVDIIHSNPGDFGLEELSGDVDFFVEGLDVIKPGCSELSLRCSHEQSIFYYAETVYPGNENNFMGVHCKKYSNMANRNCKGFKIPMGYATDSSSRGIYDLSVRAKSPYGLNANVSQVQ